MVDNTSIVLVIETVQKTVPATLAQCAFARQNDAVLAAILSHAMRQPDIAPAVGWSHAVIISRSGFNSLSRVPPLLVTGVVGLK